MKSTFFWSFILFSVSWVTSKTTPEPTSPPVPHQSKIWALLVAGSSGWYNYRHQADICHAYQILRKHGIPEENIVTMMYDDIANNEYNPNPGVIINEPNGTNVYKGVVKDYTGENVTPENFLNILQGKKEQMAGIGSGKVIESGPNDYVFVNFVDHGAPGILGFPNDNDPLHAGDLNVALVSMTRDNRFSKMFLFIEACESGSVFDGFVDENSNIFVMTAADPNESSWACYCDGPINNCLGDLFSVNWMHEAEIELLSNTTAHHLFEKVRARTLTSHVEEYGDLDIGNITNAEIIGESKGIPENKSRPFVDPNLSSVPQTEVKLAILQTALQNALAQGKKFEVTKYKKLLNDEIQKRLTHMKKMNKIIEKITDGDSNKIKILETSKAISSKAEVSKCYKAVLKDYFAKCLSFSENEFMYPSLKYFRSACNASWTDVARIKNAIHSVCQ